MPRYIDADALIAGLRKDPLFPLVEKYGLTGVIDAQPTVDAVEVVRCKNCKYRDADDFCAGRGYPNALVPDDGFCDKGERRDHA